MSPITIELVRIHSLHTLQPAHLSSRLQELGFVALSSCICYPIANFRPHPSLGSAPVVYTLHVSCEDMFYALSLLSLLSLPRSYPMLLVQVNQLAL